MHRAAALCLAVLVAGALPGPAHATDATGTARIRTATRVARLHLEFPLPAGYAQLMGAMGGNPLIGEFSRTSTVSGTRCVSSLEVVGMARKTRPQARGGKLRLIVGNEPGPGARSKWLRIDREGGSGSAHWYVGPTWSWPRGRPRPGDELDAVLVRRAPAALHRRWLVATLALTTSREPACSDARDRAIAELPATVRAVRVVEGKAGPARGAATATARIENLVPSVSARVS